MTAAAPWSVKGIDPKAREVAKELARRSGMTLGEWLNRIILEDDMPEDVTSEEQFTARPVKILGGPAYEAPKSFMSSVTPQLRPAGGSDELSRIAQSLDRLTDRIEASETRTGLAIAGVEHSVRHAMARIETAEREHMAVATRFDAAAEQLAAEQARASDRLRQIEEVSGPRSIEALKALESQITRVSEQILEGDERSRASLAGLEARLAKVEAGEDPASVIEEAVGRLGQRLADAEARTGEALDGLRDSLAALDQRMYAADTSVRGDTERRLAELADDLGRQVADSRAEIAERLAASGDATAAAEVEARLGQFEERMAEADQRSARAIETMGREVLTMAQSLNRRLQGAEQRSADAIEQVGGEMARIAGAVETRLGRTDQLHAEALERLGEEISRITERLTDRIGQSEKRAAQAIDDVGEQVSKVTERIEQRHERAASDLAERLRQSEERTQRLVESVAGERSELVEDEPFAPAPALALAVAAAPVLHAPALEAEDELPAASAVFGAELFSRSEPVSQPALDPSNPSFNEEDFAHVDAFAPASESFAPETFAPIAEADGEDDPRVETAPMAAAEVHGEDEARPQPQPDITDPAWPKSSIDASQELSTREVIAQARAAARAAAAAARPKGLFASRRPRVIRAGGLFANLKAKPPSTWQTALMVAGGAAFLSVGAAGVVLMEGPGRPNHDILPFEDGPRAAVALTPEPLGPTAPAAEAHVAPAATPAPSATPAASPTDALALDYVKVAGAVERKAPGALTRLKAIADGGHTPAQMYLARLYETGQSGVTQNLAEARRWTMRAAEAGDPSAMHNLALFYFRGEGGPADTAAAAQWFRKAAERGVVDSEYNLGLLYQSGSGVPRDLAQAYRWFSAAAAAGDAQARASALALQDKLPATQLAQAEAQAAADPAAAEGQPGSGSVTAAQKILGRLGYYKGRPDGAASRDLKLALSAYQRDQGLSVTGALDTATVSRLSVFNR